MVMAGQGGSPVAHWPCVVGVLRRLDTAAVLASLSPPSCPGALLWARGKGAGAREP
jgi:hypothetical protein